MKGEVLIQGLSTGGVPTEAWPQALGTSGAFHDPSPSLAGQSPLIPQSDCTAGVGTDVPGALARVLAITNVFKRLGLLRPFYSWDDCSDDIVLGMRRKVRANMDDGNRCNCVGLL